jgi:hypothetical protein
MGAHALADIDLLVNRQRIDIVAFRPNQKAVVPESNSTPVAVERTVRDPEAPRSKLIWRILGFLGFSSLVFCFSCRIRTADGSQGKEETTFGS